MIGKIIWITALLFLCTGCKQGPTDRGKKDPSFININFTYSPFSVDPRKQTDPVTTVVSYMLYEGLSRLEPSGAVVPALAQLVTISDDQLEYTFTLRRSMWSDGSPVTAYHFESAWKKLLDPDFFSGAASLLFPLKNAWKAKMGLCSVDDIGVRAVDAQTLCVQLERPTPYFLELTAYPTYFPVPYHGDEVLHPNLQGNFLFNGPFCLSTWKTDDYITFAKNPYYWRAEEVKAVGVYATIISDESTALKLFEQGSLDYIGGLISPLPLDSIPTLKKRKSLKQKAIAGTTFTAFNVDKFPFTNIHIRKAFASAIDKQVIVENISQMFDDLASGPVPLVLKRQAISFYNTFNSAVARHELELGLQELGITQADFPMISYSYFSSELQRNLALALQSQWKKILGIEVSLEARDFKTHLTLLRNHQFEMGQMSWIGQYHDPMSFLERFINNGTQRNYTNWQSAEYEKLIESSFYHRGAERTELLHQAEQIIVEELPIIPIYHYHLVYMQSSRLRGIAISPMGDIQFHRAFID